MITAIIILLIIIIFLAFLLGAALEFRKLYEEMTKYRDLYQQYADKAPATTLDDFQHLCGKTDKYTDGKRLTCTILGMNSEAGEAAGKLDKWIRKNRNQRITPEYSREIALEIFDTLWFCVRALHALGITFQQVADMGIDKLRSRDERGQIESLEGGDHR